MRISSSISSGENFYTDLNGFQVPNFFKFSQKKLNKQTTSVLQMIRRKRYSKLPLQANFYPLPSLGYVQDAQSRFVFFHIILICNLITTNSWWNSSRRWQKLSFNHLLMTGCLWCQVSLLGGQAGQAVRLRFVS